MFTCSFSICKDKVQPNNQNKEKEMKTLIMINLEHCNASLAIFWYISDPQH